MRSGRTMPSAVVPIGLAAALVLLVGAHPVTAGLGAPDAEAAQGETAVSATPATDSSAPDSTAAGSSTAGSSTAEPAATAQLDDDDLLRVATLRADFEGDSVADVYAELQNGDHPVAEDAAALVQDARPEVLVLTGIPFDETDRLVETLNSHYLGIAQDGEEPLAYPYMYSAPSNSGIDSGADLDGDGLIGSSGDLLGRGDYPGRYGLLVLSMVPIDDDGVRTFRDFLWDDVPDNVVPESYSDVERSVLPLFSAALWDLPLEVDGETVHLIAGARTSFSFSEADPARLRDQRQMVTDYVSPDAEDSAYIYDDEAEYGGVEGAEWIVAGDDGLGSGFIRSRAELEEEDSEADGTAETVTEIGAETQIVWADIGLDVEVR